MELRMIGIIVDVLPGYQIADLVRSAITLARQINTTIGFEFNSTFVKVDKDSNIRATVEEFWASRRRS